MQEVFLKFPFEGKSCRRLNSVWYWRPQFWANKCKGTFSEELTLGKNKLLVMDSLVG